MNNPDKAIGWRKRIGLLSPTVIETIAYDFYKVAPPGVLMCATTANIEHWDRQNFKPVLDSIMASCKYLADRHVDYIVHTGMPLVTTRGKGFEEELVGQMHKATGLPATTSIRSAVLALGALGARNVAVLTPYPDELHRSALAFLEASGFKIAGDRSLDVVFKSLQDVAPVTIATAAKDLLAAAPGADGFYIPCNQWAGADAVPLVEKQTGLPAVSGAHADYWEAFRALGISDRIEGNGRLMASLGNGSRP
jgi:maleate isomerase